MKTHTNLPGVIIPIIAIILGLGFCVYMSKTQGFGVRCERAGYAPNTAAYERCVYRVEQGGPVFEENIGLVTQR